MFLLGILLVNNIVIYKQKLKDSLSLMNRTILCCLHKMVRFIMVVGLVEYTILFMVMGNENSHKGTALLAPFNVQ